MPFDLAEQEWRVTLGREQGRDDDHRAEFLGYAILEIHFGERARRHKRDHEAIDEIDHYGGDR